jgi:hypothetical protein
MLHQQPVYVHGLFTLQSMHVCELTQTRVRTHLSLFKNKKTRQTYRAGKDGMHLIGDHNPLKESVNMTETQKESKNPINQPKNLLKNPREIPSIFTSYASRKIPPLNIPGFKI